ncbi:recombinase family protein [Serratia marcescens]
MFAPSLVIASELNRRQILAENGSCWSRAKVHQILTSEKYIGNSVYNKTSFKLKQQYVTNPEEDWIRYDGAYTPIVSVEKFNRANEIIKARAARLSEDELLEKLRVLLRKKGRLSGIIIDEEELLPSSSIYRSRFGSLLRVYQLIDYTPETDYTWLKTKKQVNEFNDRSTKKIIDNISHEGGWVSDTPAPGILHINDEFTLAIQSARCQRISPQRLRWKIKFRTMFSPDISIAVRMDSSNQSAVDYYIFPAIDILSEKISLEESNPYQLDLYRFDNLAPFYRLIRRVKLKDS